MSLIVYFLLYDSSVEEQVSVCTPTFTQMHNEAVLVGVLCLLNKCGSVVLSSVLEPHSLYG